MIRRAFTIVELAIAMAFISFLILAIGTVNTQITQIYQKGLTLKSVNDTSRELTDEFVKAIEDAVFTTSCSVGTGSAALVCEKNGAKRYVYNKLTETMTDVSSAVAVPTYGAFCTGKYSYVWNSGYKNDQGMKYDVTGTEISYDSSSSSSSSSIAFRLLRVNDSSSKLCQPMISSGAFPKSVGGVLKLPSTSNPTELLTNSEDHLALYDLTIFPTTYHENTGHSFVSGTYILGTVTNDPKKDVNITTSENICSGHPTDNFTTDFVYCSINRFNFAGRASGR